MNEATSDTSASLHLKKPTRKPGVKPQYRDDYPAQAHKLCLLGVQDRDLAAFFGVCRKTIINWKNTYPDFADAITRGKKSADMEVAASLYQATLDRVITTKQAIKCKEIYYDDKSEVTENTAQQRAFICAICPNAKQGKLLAFIKDSLTEIEGAYCALCHCPLSAKVRSTDICPDNKWNDTL